MEGSDSKITAQPSCALSNESGKIPSATLPNEELPEDEKHIVDCDGPLRRSIVIAPVGPRETRDGGQPLATLGGHASALNDSASSFVSAASLSQGQHSSDLEEDESFVSCLGSPGQEVVAGDYEGLLRGASTARNATERLELLLRALEVIRAVLNAVTVPDPSRGRGSQPICIQARKNTWLH